MLGQSVLRGSRCSNAIVWIIATFGLQMLPVRPGFDLEADSFSDISSQTLSFSLVNLPKDVQYEEVAYSTELLAAGTPFSC